MAAGTAAEHPTRIPAAMQEAPRCHAKEERSRDVIAATGVTVAIEVGTAETGASDSTAMDAVTAGTADVDAVAEVARVAAAEAAATAARQRRTARRSSNSRRGPLFSPQWETPRDGSTPPGTAASSDALARATSR